MTATLIGSDGLRVRSNGRWGEQKLAFLDHFAPPALDATTAKRTRYYIDLFAGPGLNVTAHAPRKEFEGSPVRLLQMHGSKSPATAFTHAVFVNANANDHHALEARVNRLVAEGKSRIRRERIQLIREDANVALPRILEHVHRKSYVFAFADIEGPRQWPWASVRALRRTGHESVDLYMLFPLHMGIDRLFPYNRTITPRCADTVTTFFGTEDWKELERRRRTDAESPRMYRELEDLYLRQLRQQWNYAESVMNVRMTGSRFLYQMFFASNHDAGRRIAQWARRQAREDDSAIAGQGDLFAG